MDSFISRLEVEVRGYGKAYGPLVDPLLCTSSRHDMVPDDVVITAADQAILTEEKDWTVVGLHYVKVVAGVLERRNTVLLVTAAAEVRCNMAQWWSGARASKTSRIRLLP